MPLLKAMWEKTWHSRSSYNGYDWELVQIVHSGEDVRELWSLVEDGREISRPFPDNANQFEDESETVTLPESKKVKTEIRGRSESKKVKTVKGQRNTPSCF